MAALKKSNEVTLKWSWLKRTAIGIFACGCFLPRRDSMSVCWDILEAQIFPRVTDNWELTVKIFTLKWGKDNERATISFRYISETVPPLPVLGTTLIDSWMNTWQWGMNTCVLSLLRWGQLSYISVFYSVNLVFAFNGRLLEEGY